jgi:dolichyl-phosphate-mannose-protein mannosyltransferase
MKATSRDLLLCAALGTAVLLAARPFMPARLGWSDEIVYAVVARNVADGKGPLSNLVHPEAVLAQGFPVRDVHMPGHPYLVAAAFRFFGVSDSVAVGPSRVAFVLAGCLLLVAGTILFDRRAGWIAAALFFLFPGLAVYAHAAMAETTVLLWATAYLAVWAAGLRDPKLPYALMLAVLLAIGATHRETLLVLLPSALYLLLRWPRPTRAKAALVLLLPLALYLALVFWPFYRARPAYPVTVTLRVAPGAPLGELAGALLENALANLRVMLSWRGASWQWMLIVEALLMAAAVVAAVRHPETKRLAVYTLFGFTAVAGAMTCLYTLRGWPAVRSLLFTEPPALVVLGALIGRRGRPGTMTAAVLGVCSMAGLAVDRILIADRHEEYAAGQAEAQALRASIPLDAHVVFAPRAYRYGWEAYPASVVVWGSEEGRRRALNRVVALDAVVLGPEETGGFLAGVAAGAYGAPFRPVPAHLPSGRALFVREGPGR